MTNLQVSRGAKWLLLLCLGVFVLSITLSPAGAQTQIDTTQIGVDGPNRAKMTAVVMRPTGGTGLPVLLILHGSEGVHDGYVQWAPHFARAGYLTMLACWFGTSGGPYACPSVPAIGTPNLFAARNVGALIDAARRVPGARPDRVGLIGNSLGGAMVALAMSSGLAVQAGVAISGPFDEVVSRNDSSAAATIANLRGPLLILHGTTDTNVPVQQAKGYEDRARRLGKNVQSFYYEGAPHGLPWNSSLAADVFQRSIGFLDQYARR
jgi:dienelactone hydrolase